MERCFRIEVLVQPGARRAEVAAWDDGVVRARVAAPPTEGQANEALIVLLAKTLGVPKSAVSIVRGRRSRRKLVEVAGLSIDEGTRRLERGLARE